MRVIWMMGASMALAIASFGGSCQSDRNGATEADRATSDADAQRVTQPETPPPDTTAPEVTTRAPDGIQDASPPPAGITQAQAEEKERPGRLPARTQATSREPLEYDVVDMTVFIEEVDTESGFAMNAFPPTIPDTEWHRDAWMTNTCMRCHETGVQDAPLMVHRGLPDHLQLGKCRSCHVLIPGKTTTRPRVTEPTHFAANAFPPMMPNSESHKAAWTTSDCLMCHETGAKGAPLVVHKDLPRRLLSAKCRTCHVQVRSHETDPWEQ